MLRLSDTSSFILMREDCFLLAVRPIINKRCWNSIRAHFPTSPEETREKVHSENEGWKVENNPEPPPNFFFISFTQPDNPFLNNSDIST